MYDLCDFQLSCKCADTWETHTQTGTFMKPHYLLASLIVPPQGPAGLKGEEGLAGPAGTVVRMNTLYSFLAPAISLTTFLFRMLQPIKQGGCFHGDGWWPLSH